MNESSLRTLLEKAAQDPAFRRELENLLNDASPSPMGSPLSEEDLAHVSGGVAPPPIESTIRERLSDPKMSQALVRLLALR